MKPMTLFCLFLLLVFTACASADEVKKANELNKSLLEAVTKGNFDEVKSLISKGADVDAKDEWGYTPLYYAIWNEDIDMVKLLADKGADVNVLPNHDGTPLEYAVWNQDVEMVKFFVARGAKFDVKDNDGWTAFRYAVSQANRELVEFFVSKDADVSRFHGAACVGDLDRVKDFIQQGTEIDAKDEMDWTALYWAASMGQTDVVEYLIEGGANVNAKAEDRSTPLHQAARAGAIKLIKLLIAKGADVNPKDKRGNTPLHRSASAGHPQVVELLIAKGADVNAKTQNNSTPLHRAALAGHKEVVQLLITNGADVTIKDRRGRTPLDWAKQREHTEVVDLLLNNKASINAALLSAAQSGDKGFVEQLLDRGADVNVQDHFGLTPLHLAAVKGRKNIVEFLLATGARIDSRDNAGRIPLHYASGAGGLYGGTDWAQGADTDTARLLLNRGANINATDNVGWTPLHYATWVSLLRGKVDMIELLLNKAADLNTVNERGRTPLSLARSILSMATAHPKEKEIADQYRKIAELLHRDRITYYVARNGKDSNPGTLERPLRTLAACINVAGAGDTIFVRGGVHSYSSTIHIDKSGQAGSPICLRAYPGESPVFDFSASKGDGFFITGAYWHIKGLTVTGAEYWGIVVETKGGHHNILDQLTAYANAGTGVFVLNGAANNLILNCDSYRNFDPQTNGENTDGFAAARALGKGNVLIGCRAWNNADDGFDSGMGDAGVRLENCYVWRNGENIWGHPCFTGNANGFKLGSGNHVLIRCVAWDHPVRGFKLQGEATGVTLYNCTAFRNRTNYQFIWPRSNIEKNVLRNCLSFRGGIQIKPKLDDQFNSWNVPLEVEITEDDFMTIDDTDFTGARNPDGSIPESDFLRLAPGSDAIDAGTDVGLPFLGKAPDLGAFEHRPAAEEQSYVKMLHQYVRDHDMEKIRKMVAADADVNEKDWLGYAPLHWAVYFGYLDVAELLLDNGAEPNLKSDTGRTPLEIATSMGCEQIVELLRKHGAK